MRLFANLAQQLSACKTLAQKLAALKTYFLAAPPLDAAWAVQLLLPKKLPRLLSTAKLKDWAREESGLPQWLFEESCEAVSDLCEVAALLFAPIEEATETGESLCPDGLSIWMERWLPTFEISLDRTQRDALTLAWKCLPPESATLLNQLLTGTFKPPVTLSALEEGLSLIHTLPLATISSRLAQGYTHADYPSLLQPVTQSDELTHPYPFEEPELIESAQLDLMHAGEWLIENERLDSKVQLICRGGHSRLQIHIWSLSNKLLTNSPAWIEELKEVVPCGTVLIGYLISHSGDQAYYFEAEDCLELNRKDLRSLPRMDRRSALENLIHAAGNYSRLRLRPHILYSNWHEIETHHATLRGNGISAILIKRPGAPYGELQSRSLLRWKARPLTSVAVLLYAEAPDPRSQKSVSVYTFAVWHEEELVVIAKVTTGLTASETRALDEWIRRTTYRKSGPVCFVPPHQVFELEFDLLVDSPRQKARVRMEGAKIKRWRADLSPSSVGTLTGLIELFALK